MAISNVSLTNTFDEWRVTTNQLIVVTNDLLGDGLTTYRSVTANVVTANTINVTSIFLGSQNLFETLVSPSNVVLRSGNTMTGNLIFSGANISFSNNSNSGIYWNNSGSTFLYSSNANTLVLGTSNAERVRFDSNGNILVSRSTPIGLATGRGSAQPQIGINGSTYTKVLMMPDADGAYSSILSGFTLWPQKTISGDYQMNFDFGNEGAMVFYTNQTTERMRIGTDVSGNTIVGIGTSSPRTTLEVSGSVSISKANVLSQTLTDNTSISWDTANGQIATVTLGGNRTLINATNLRVGTYILHVIQDATGGRTLTFSNQYRFTGNVAPPLTSSANARDMFSFVSDGTRLYGALIPDVG